MSVCVCVYGVCVYVCMGGVGCVGCVCVCIQVHTCLVACEEIEDNLRLSPSASTYLRQSSLLLSASVQEALCLEIFHEFPCLCLPSS